ncbi:MAG: response regulator transcription factor [Candidatus Aminicenantes bacterium]|nr:response regulator transcription factor [Candidatus Aminicenantes bacterium]
MRILIVEDEPPVARYIERCCRNILKNKIKTIDICFTLQEASTAIQKKSFDLCLLDLNLKGASGYDLLRLSVSETFHTIIISAHTEQAVEAFQYGVLDFVPKPFEEEDLRSALKRYFDRIQKQKWEMKYLTARKGDSFVVYPVNHVLYFKAADVYVEAHLQDGKVELLNKTMDRLEQILPPSFFRIHRSYIVALSTIESYTHIEGGTCQVHLKGEIHLPLSRRRTKDLKERMELS